MRGCIVAFAGYEAFAELGTGQGVGNPMLSLIAPDRHEDNILGGVCTSGETRDRESSVVGIEVFALAVDFEAVDCEDDITTF